MHNVSSDLQSILLPSLEYTTKVLPEDGAIGAETCRSVLMYVWCILLCMCIMLVC